MNSHQKLARCSYYLQHAGKACIPRRVYGASLRAMLTPPEPLPFLQERLNYYVKTSETSFLHPETTPFTLNLGRGRSTYQLDLWEVYRRFPPGLKVACVFGDNIREPDTPALVKSRPVPTDRSNAILFRLNHIRHFSFINDPLPYTAKRNQLVWRGNAFQPQRRAFLERYFDHPLCNVGHYHKKPQPEIPWTRRPLSIREQLKYKFILAIEGNDVATNLKWAMASNSLCFMARPKYETWFMEGALQPGVHYAQLAEDYSDLEENLDHYLSHPGEAETIIRAANAWTRQFRTSAHEQYLTHAVLAAYFNLTGQGTFP